MIARKPQQASFGALSIGGDMMPSLPNTSGLRAILGAGVMRGQGMSSPQTLPPVVQSENSVPALLQLLRGMAR